MKVAVAQPDPSAAARSTHTFSEQREGRDHTRRATEAQTSRFTSRLSAVDGSQGPEAFTTLQKTNKQLKAKPAILEYTVMVRWTGPGFFLPTNLFCGLLNSSWLSGTDLAAASSSVLTTGLHRKYTNAFKTKALRCHRSNYLMQLICGGVQLYLYSVLLPVQLQC